MAKYSKNKNQQSDKTQQEAKQIANGIKKLGQTKEQTKLVTQGIAKGIELYKKQQKAKARELDKAQKKAAKAQQQETTEEVQTESVSSKYSALLPWVLLGLSWAGFLSYLLLPV
ncbi:DUF2956 domain-containing protein [Bermanella marisrubri]|uniref:DUF2956 domain-containing protein n=1 Tax=Bermanella marisrubri TaxID=207949 RepID=Q1N5P1_9GAMM|nr:DUF2956 domain-containing protein [Bermanella marisrubri]EAT13901.1 hypothetical protein RED65_10924 [Oceanobacter sp. RED65] [Bermanella marisrubri]QIZ84656.1 DUF2956 domain-containing protein [Bermanella marisrubri]